MIINPEFNATHNYFASHDVMKDILDGLAKDIAFMEDDQSPFFAYRYASLEDINVNQGKDRSSAYGRAEAVKTIKEIDDHGTIFRIAQFCRRRNMMMSMNYSPKTEEIILQFSPAHTFSQSLPYFQEILPEVRATRPNPVVAAYKK